MKTKIIFCLLSFIFLQALPAAAVKKIEANPINVAVMLTEQQDSASLAKTCDFYGYLHQGNQDGYAVFKHQNGSLIRFKLSPEEDGKHYSTIEVSSKATQKDRDDILKGLNFQKSGNAYERRSLNHIINCTSGPNSTLIFRQQAKSKSRKTVVPTAN